MEDSIVPLLKGDDGEGIEMVRQINGPSFVTGAGGYQLVTVFKEPTPILRHIIFIIVSKRYEGSCGSNDGWSQQACRTFKLRKALPEVV